MSPNDPWLWSATELVAKLCHDTALFQEIGLSLEHLPDRAILEHRLLSQKINGSAFLTRFDIHTLRTELSLDNLGQRILLVSLITLLRQKSPLYAQRRTTIGVESLNLTHTRHEENLNGRKRQKVTQVDAQPSRAQTADYSHLLRWQSSAGADDVVDFAALDELPFEDLQGGGDYEEDELLDAEENEEEEERDDGRANQSTQVRCKLTRDTIIGIINDSIAQFTDAWKPNAGVPREEWITYDPETMWEEAEAKAERQQLVTNCEADVGYYTDHLNLLCEEILDFPGNNADAIRRQCKNLEMTVNNLELARWLLSIYELSPESNSEEDVQDIDEDSLPPWNIGNQLISDSEARHVAGQIIDLGSPPTSSASGTQQVSLPRHETIDPTVGYTSSPPIANQFPSHGLTSPEAEVIVTIEATSPPKPETFILMHGAQPDALVNHGENPENASISTVRRCKWEDLVGTLDRKRVVTKAIHEMLASDREDVRNRLEVLERTKIEREIKVYVNMLAGDETRIHGVLPRDLLKIETMSRLFISWWYCDNYSTKTPQKEHLEELKQCFEDGSSEMKVFFDFISTIITTTFSKEALRHPEQPSQAEIIVISDDEDDAPKTPETARHKKKKPHEESGSQQGSAIVLD